MTTIAYKDGTIAADSGMTVGSQLLHVDKLHRLSDGTVIGCAGDAMAAAKFLEWLECGCCEESPILEDTLSVLRLTDEGVLFYTGDCSAGVLITEPFAIGSGDDFARAGMYMGMTAEQAVELAVELDIYSRLPVISMQYEEPELEEEEAPVKGLWDILYGIITSL